MSQVHTAQDPASLIRHAATIGDGSLTVVQQTTSLQTGFVPLMVTVTFGGSGPQIVFTIASVAGFSIQGDNQGTITPTDPRLELPDLTVFLFGGVNLGTVSASFTADYVNQQVAGDIDWTPTGSDQSISYQGPIAYWPAMAAA